MKKLSTLLALIFVLTCGVSAFAQDNHNMRGDDNGMHQRRHRHHRRNHDGRDGRDHERGNDNHH